MAKLMTTGAVLALAMMAVPAAAVSSWDAFGSFDGTQGAGRFVYGQIDNATNPQFTNTAACAVVGSVCLQSNANNVPGAYKSTAISFQYGSVDVPDDRLLLHPGASNAVYVNWSVPTAGSYVADLDFKVVDRRPTGVDLFSVVSRSGVVTVTSLGALVAPLQTAHFNFTVTNLAAADFVGVIIGNAGNYSNDSTGLNFSVSSVASIPEPASWALMIGGFGMVGSALRRRRVQAA
ncbi:MAG TPA: PEPxxWA-CTERM sorting domain-containing protein [Polymorphobacter sp.]|nr:PEPxxWA-CTERM sorting domain-containing protein [Polymorphobacter sp.]